MWPAEGRVPRYVVGTEDWKMKKPPPSWDHHKSPDEFNNSCEDSTVITTTNTPSFNEYYLNTGNRPGFPIIVTSKNLYVIDTNVLLHERDNVAKCVDALKKKCGHQLVLPEVRCWAGARVWGLWVCVWVKGGSGGGSSKHTVHTWQHEQPSSMLGDALASPTQGGFCLWHGHSPPIPAHDINHTTSYCKH
jgi:hypothetical protein